MIQNLTISVLLLLLSLSTFSQVPAAYTEWVAKANTFYDAKQFKKAGEAFSKAFASNDGKGYPDDRYNAACCWALARNNDSAFFNLNRLATRVSYSEYNQLTTDPDLANLHTDGRWLPLCELVKQNKEKAEANLNNPLVAMLDTIMENDQKYRKQIRAIESKYGNPSKEMTELWKTINYYDSVDLIKIVALIDKYGWLGADVVGRKGNQTIFLVIQHADIIVQDKYLPLMREAVENKKAEPSELALLEDRVAMRHGRKQIYGSQIMYGNLAPLEDPDNVDKRRAAVGLEPLADYLLNFGIKWDVAEYKKQHPDTK